MPVTRDDVNNNNNNNNNNNENIQFLLRENFLHNILYERKINTFAVNKAKTF